MKAKKKVRKNPTRYKRVPSLGRSPLTGALVLKSAARGASVSRSEMMRAVRALKSLTAD